MAKQVRSKEQSIAVSLPAKEGFVRYRLIALPARQMCPALREANIDAGQHPRGTRPGIAVGDEFYDYPPPPAKHQQVPGARYGSDWSRKRAYIKVEKDTPAFSMADLPKPPPPVLTPWKNLREHPFWAEGGGVYQVTVMVLDNQELLADTCYDWGEERVSVLDGIDDPGSWGHTHGHGGWTRLRAVYVAISNALAAHARKD